MSIRPSPIPLAHVSGLSLLATPHQIQGLKTDLVEQHVEPGRPANALTTLSGDPL